jgi:pimeloyl-ACP methyl ester carboxylesterase/DNA-binding CsgD family transcriptional regulator
VPGQAEQEIRFVELDGRPMAYAVVGSGPALVLPALWVSHLELEWTMGAFRSFVAALARGRTVIRYDRLGTGLSDPDGGPAELTIDAEVRALETLMDALGLESAALLGISWGGSTAAAFTARRPERVIALAVVGACASGEGIAPPALRDALVSTVRAHWGAGSRMLADVWLPGADAYLRDDFARLQQAAASPEVAAATLEAVYGTDIRDALASVRAPALVVHRRGDRAMPFALGRDLAARIPGARLVALDGDVHPPWLGDSRAVLRALDDFLPADPSAARAAAPPPAAGTAAPPAPRGASGDGPLTDRELAVLRLVAEGLSDAEIGERLVVSPHTVHRHVANIRSKLRQPSRAAAVARAARLGLI